jgi:hypothetical protein
MESLRQVSIIAVEASILPFALWAFLFYVISGFLWIIALLLFALVHRILRPQLTLILSLVFVLYSLLVLGTQLSPVGTSILLIVPEGLAAMRERSVLLMYFVFALSFVASTLFVLRKAWNGLRS